MALDTFLRRKQMQSWRIPVMIDCGAIKVFSEGRELPLKKGPKTHVDGGDKIRIEDPLSKQCQEALQQKVDTEARDYAWVPGTSPFDKAMGKLIEARPRTIRMQVFPGDPIDEDAVRALVEELRAKLADFERQLPRCKVVILSDYGKGGLTHIADMIKAGEIQLVFTTVDETRAAIVDSRHIRQAALANRVTYYTTMAGCEAAVEGMKHKDGLLGDAAAG